ncbi:MAG: hypothetical protein R6U95_07645 [Bacteroidales bacterium]
MHIHLKQLLFILCTTVFSYTQAQYVTYGNDKGNTTWQQIQTDNFQVIFPENYDSVALLFTHKLEQVYNHVTKSLEHEPAKISVLLHNQSDISNGFVTWAPKRVEIFNTIPQDQPAQDWFNQLAIHEFRHVVQTDMINRGLTHLLSFLLGEQAIGAVTGLYLPMWFLEGDAVGVETSFSNSGRGRQAEFSMGLRTHLTQDIIYSYDKAYFGSYKDYVPNYYAMGYYFVAGVRRKYSQDVWNNALKRVGDKPFSITPFNKALKIETGLSKTELYKETFKQQQNLWKLDFQREAHSAYDTVSTQPTTYTNYQFAQQIAEDSIIIQKSGFEDIPFFITMHRNGRENNICRVGFKSPKEPFSATRTYIAWSEKNADIRWDLAATRNINLYDLTTHTNHVIHTHTQVFSPAISPDNNLIVAIQSTEKNIYSLFFYDIHTQKHTHTVPIPKNEFPQNPSWNKDGNTIVFTTVSEKGKRIMQYNTNTKTFSEIKPYSYEDIATPTYWKKYVLYSSSYSGVDNIYAIDTNSSEIYRITESAYGSKYPSTYKDTLLFSDYQIHGFVLGKKALTPQSWHPIEVIKKERYSIATNLQARENGPIHFNTTPDTKYDIQPYRKITHLFNIHSWMPFYMEYNSGDISDNGLGFQLLSQNILSTMTASGGYKQTNNGSKRTGYANLHYSGFYPIITGEFAQGYETFNNTITSQNIESKYKLKETYLQINIPFNLSSRGYYRYINLIGSAHYTDYTLNNVDPQEFTDYFSTHIQQTNAIYYIQFSNTRSRVAKDLAPRYAQRISSGTKQSIFKNSSSYSNSFFGEVELYFPGILPHHSLQLYGGYEYNTITPFTNNVYYYKNSIRVPRGFQESISQFKHLYTLQSSYSLPLAYPDIHIGPVMYIKRIYLQAFADITNSISTNNLQWIGRNSENNHQKIISSSGLAINSNMHIFRTLPEFTIGLQYSYLHQTSTQVFDFLFNFKL